ncbi:MAG: lipase maturation factor family protein [Candidatus Margulisiibacteriota bacterium]|nr:lipase maturation factor family protein [Candidatus Margulisiibacteriota bacterium]
MLKLLELAPKHFLSYLFKSFSNTLPIRLYLRLLGGVFFINFASLLYQFNDLALLDTSIRFPKFSLPFFFNVFNYIDYSYALTVLIACFVLSIFLILLFIPFFSLLLIGFLYSSLIYFFPTFLSFQWDLLLIETALLSTFLISPTVLILRKNNKLTLFNIQLLPLIFLSIRLFFHSGLVKIFSNSRYWKTLTAMDYHLFSQPMPHFLSYHVNNLVISLNLSPFLVFMMFVIELIIPFGLLFSAYRRTSAIILIFFQCSILLTGNFGYFNFLVICPLLLFVLIDFDKSKIKWPNLSLKLPRSYYYLFLFFIISTSSYHLVFRSVPQSVSNLSQSFNVFNNYGLFASMTTNQTALTISVSKNGADWIPLNLKYYDKFGYPTLDFVQPYLPRIRWQFWFLFLSSQTNFRWIRPFYATILNDPNKLSTFITPSDQTNQSFNYLKVCFRDIVFNLDRNIHSIDYWYPISSFKCNIIKSQNIH